MTTGALVSFIVPTYNRSALVRRAVESVLAQAGDFARPFELIVFDDGSTDGTSAVLAEYADHPAVVLLGDGQNHGLGHARNAAFARATGEWCALLDSDNALLPGAARELERALIDLPDDVGVLWGGCLDSNGVPTVTHGVTGRLSGSEVIRRRLSGEHFSVIRRELARDAGYPSLGTRHACEPAFWATVGFATDYFISPVLFQHYETGGEDRFCALDSRLRRADDLARCYAHTAGIMRQHLPGRQWELMGKAAFYRCAAGDWMGGVRDGLRLIPGLHHAWRNSLILASCLAGPRASRWLLRRTSAA